MRRIMKKPDIIIHGGENGEGMIIHSRTSRGTDIFGLAIPNIYTDTDWDLGPTWCYLIFGNKITLIDTGRLGNYELFKKMIRSLDMQLSDIDRIIISHHHEDHDGNLADIISDAKPELWAHEIYNAMISYHPHEEAGAPRPEFPGGCRLCFMPEEHSKNCLTYQKNRSQLQIDFIIRDKLFEDEDRLFFVHTPGHTPDSICVLLEDEVLFAGDTLLPDITPHPSLEEFFNINRGILPAEFRHENTVYGLKNYIKSLKKIIATASRSEIMTFPGHRLFYNNRFNLLPNAALRAEEIINFHKNRCADILDLIADEPASLENITTRHFPSHLLKKGGKIMAQHEILAHIELLETSGDIFRAAENQQNISPTGSETYKTALSVAQPGV